MRGRDALATQKITDSQRSEESRDGEHLSISRCFAPLSTTSSVRVRLLRETYVYIVASKSAVLYVGVTSHLISRIDQHKRKLMPGFTAKYNVNILVYYEAFPQPIQAIEAEKKIKGWTRAKKIALIESENPTWQDLYDDLIDEEPPPTRDSSLRSE